VADGTRQPAVSKDEGALFGLLGTDIIPAIEHRTRADDRCEQRSSISQTKLILKVLAMRQTDVAAPDLDLMLGAKLTQAVLRFVASLGVLIGVSLLLASL
jgi:hypothetical protein